MCEVVACGYLGLSSDDFGAWRSFARALGVQVSEHSTDDKLLLRVDERAYRVCVEPGAPGVSYVGWEVATEKALETLVERVRQAGVDVTEEAGLATERGVERLVRCVDPGGNQLEFFVGARVPAEPFVSPTGTRFVTRKIAPGDLGFGHVVVSFEDLEAAKTFYFDVLGFTLSDICLPHGPWIFTHVNPRHHSFAFGLVPGPSEYHHFSLEVENLDEVGLALDRLAELDIPLAATLGKHTNDEMFSFYVRSPSGIEVEYGFGGRLIDDDAWSPTTYDADSAWGHHQVTA